MRSAIALGIALALGAGCSFPTVSEEYRCDQTSDCEMGRVCTGGFCVAPGEVDAGNGSGSGGGTDAPAFDCTSWSAPRHFLPCDLPAPSGPLALDSGSYTYDTTTGTLAGASAIAVASKLVGAARVIAVERLSIGAGATLRVTGTRPLIIASWSAIDVSGTIDASSGGSPGAGANPTDCSSHAATVAQDADVGASGGGGGGFQGAGGRGGFGDAGNPGAGGGGVAMPLLLGGCPGNRGGNGDQVNGGVGGAGGGAVQLTARQAITISGRVHAGGAGGGGATGSDGGGGGGGAGGMIGLESPSITVKAGAILAANGGGGGQGSNLAPGGTGQPGAASATPASGGTGGDSATGGTGGSGATLAGAVGQDSVDHGAGGGGGGAGYIALKGQTRQLDAGAVVSPAATIVP